MRVLYAARAVGILFLLALAMFKNNISYPGETRTWRVIKSLVDTGLIVLAAVFSPALLVGWIVMWATRPIARQGIQITLAVIFGAIFSAVGGFALEILCFLGIFAVDLLSGKNGVYGWWTQNPPDTFMPYLESQRPKRVS